jgi:hypothetical protein
LGLAPLCFSKVMLDEHHGKHEKLTAENRL